MRDASRGRHECRPYAGPRVALFFQRFFMGAAAGLHATFTPRPLGSYPMLDAVYVACTIAFFALMLAFVRGLELLGRDRAADDQDPR